MNAKVIKPVEAKPTVKCMLCDREINGRTDKKFCNDECRSVYNNNLKRDRNNYVRLVNNRLLKNRYILESLVPFAGTMAKTTKEILIKKGFLFGYHTHSHINKKSNTYYYSYEYGYLALEDGQYLIVKQKNLT